MGVVVGEKIARAIERAIDEASPGRHRLLLGRRTHDGGRAVVDADGEDLRPLSRISIRARLPYISVLTDPTTGGVTASFAMLGDLNIAEPKALIGFAGPRVIEQTIRQKLPEGFQRSEFPAREGHAGPRRRSPGIESRASSAPCRFMGASQRAQTLAEEPSRRARASRLRGSVPR